jgi:5-methylthioadenosine/S-adenosylhomocysteine deaminase
MQVCTPGRWKLSLLLFLLLSTGVARAQDLVLSGVVVTPDKVVGKGWVVIKEGHILSILESAPEATSAPTIETNGIIFPGFIDLHDHPMYNIFKRWTPRTKFKNRYEWRDLPEYNALVGRPGGELQRKDDQTFCDIDEYVELKALIGGTTSITGISGRGGVTPPVPSCIFGNERVENTLGVAPRDLKDNEFHRISDELAGKKIDLLLIHVAEGSSADT